MENVWLSPSHPRLYRREMEGPNTQQGRQKNQQMQSSTRSGHVNTANKYFHVEHVLSFGGFYFSPYQLNCFLFFLFVLFLFPSPQVLFKVQLFNNNKMRPEVQQELSHILLTELLAYQFASPVRWYVLLLYYYKINPPQLSSLY